MDCFPFLNINEMILLLDAKFFFVVRFEIGVSPNKTIPKIQTVNCVYNDGQYFSIHQASLLVWPFRQAFFNA